MAEKGVIRMSEAPQAAFYQNDIDSGAQHGQMRGMFDHIGVLIEDNHFKEEEEIRRTFRR